MKFKIMFKSPDTVSNAIDYAVTDEVEHIEGLSEEEREILKESRIEKLQDYLKRWLHYGECITIEFDTETHTATVQNAKD